MLIELLLTLITPVFGQTCFDKLDWSTSQGQIIVNGFPLMLKGVNYFGFDTEAYAPHGLWRNDLDFYLDFIKNNDFNAIRVPFSLAMIKNDPIPNLNCTTREQLFLCGKSAMELLDYFIDKAAERGLLIMLDNHRITPGGGVPELWYNMNYPEFYVKILLTTIVKRYSNRWNFFAFDLKNEPHDRATWGYSKELWWKPTNWNKAAEEIISYVSSHFDGLMFVGGIDWGTSFEGAALTPIETNHWTKHRVVLSPHCFGPSVYERPEFQDADFPNNLDSIYHSKFGFLENQTGFPVVVGAWGGRFYPGTRDEKWNNWFVDWMITNRLTNNFYWCLNPNSGDTGGLLEDDWTTPAKRKLELLKRLQPYPTKFAARKREICITPGFDIKEANAKIKKDTVF